VFAATIKQPILCVGVERFVKTLKGTCKPSKPKFDTHLCTNFYDLAEQSYGVVNMRM